MVVIRIRHIKVDLVVHAICVRKSSDVGKIISSEIVGDDFLDVAADDPRSSKKCDRAATHLTDVKHKAVHLRHSG